MKTTLPQAFINFDRAVEKGMQHYRTPSVSAALTDREQTLYQKAYGFSILENRSPLKSDDRFPIASVSKSFTALAVLQAAEAGKLDLRAPIQEYLPWFKIRSRFAAISLHHLLSHTSGLPQSSDFSPGSISEIWAYREFQPRYAPGTRFSYSDLGYKIAGLILETVLEKPYVEIIQNGLLTPLKMEHTTAVMTREMYVTCAHGYEPLYDDRPYHPGDPLTPAPWIESNSGDGCILSTAEDMARYARMLLNNGVGPDGPLLSAAHFESMVAPWSEEGYGYGLNVYQNETYCLIGHGGDMPGYEAYLWLDRDHGLGSVVLMSHPYVKRLGFYALDFLRAAYFEQPLPEPSFIPDPLTIANSSEFAGTYISGKRKIRIDAQEQRLWLNVWGDRVAVEQHGEDHFYAAHSTTENFFLKALRSKNGLVIGFDCGPDEYLRENASRPELHDTPEKWLAYPGHYRSHNPWLTNFRVILRRGRLWLIYPDGEEIVLTTLKPGVFRPDDDSESLDQLQFGQFINGKACMANLNGCEYYRFFTP